MSRFSEGSVHEVAHDSRSTLVNQIPEQYYQISRFTLRAWITDDKAVSLWKR